MTVGYTNLIEIARIPRNIYLQTEMITVFTTRSTVKGALWSTLLNNTTAGLPTGLTSNYYYPRPTTRVAQRPYTLLTKQRSSITITSQQSTAQFQLRGQSTETHLTL